MTALTSRAVLSSLLRFGRSRRVPDAFEQIYDEHFAFVWRNARRLGVSPADVDDVVQETFVVVHRRLREFEGRSAVRTWLYGILVRIVMGHRRRARKHAHETFDEDVDAGSEGEVEGVADALARKEAADVLAQILDALDDGPRAVLVLVEFEEATVPEAADALGINLNTAYTRLRAGRAQLAAALKRHHAKQASVGALAGGALPTGPVPKTRSDVP